MKQGSASHRSSRGKLAGDGLQFEALEQRHMLSGDGLGNAALAGSSTNSSDAAIASIATATESTAVALGAEAATGPAAFSGELKRWHKVTLDFSGPNTSETATNNPFLNYRLDVTFTHQGSGKSYTVPGYYAADGNAANTSAESGNLWRVHFAPDEIGDWGYSVSFRTGTNVAVSTAANPGVSAGFVDGGVGSFAIAETDKSGIDLRGKGRLEYVGERYLKFAGSGEYFLKQGTDSPENLLAYNQFDGPFASDGQGDNLVKSWAPHVADWNLGDPTWGNGEGKGIIGAVNYLASEGLNAFSFLPMNIGGDDKNVFPYLDYNERFRMDVSRLAQWEVLFEHADTKGMFLHFKTQETENDQLLDGGDLGNQRRLYYRELIARFSHHLALNWNLGEENTNTSQQVKDFAQFFHDNDPYQHHIVLHTFPGQKDQRYDPLLGNASELTGVSLQTNQEDFRNIHGEVVKWVNDSAAAGKPWAVAVDEPGDPQHAIRPDNDAGNSHEYGRKNALWGTLLGGGWGNEYYFGYGHAHSDLTLQDFRSRDQWWDYTRYALEFFEDNDVPFWDMENDNSISTATNDYGFQKPGDSYVVYLKDGGTTRLALPLLTGELFDVRWFDPRNGGALQVGSINAVEGGGLRPLGNAPNNPDKDWVILVSKREETGPNTPPEVAITAASPLTPTSSGVFQEQNGLVVFEMESQPATDGWQEQNSVAGFTGDGYYRWEGPDLFGNPGAQGVTEYKINITNPGTYQMRFHNHRDGGIPFDQENDIWTQMDNGTWAKVFSGTQGQWNWVSQFDFGEGNRPAASYQLSAGEHTFRISGRSQGFRVDRVAFYNTSLTSASVALNLNTPQSPDGSNSGGGGDGLTYQLTGTALDDAQILLTPQVQWSLDRGPGTATFSDPQSNNTEVEFSVPGAYTVRFTADDGEFTSSTTRKIIAPMIEPQSSEETFTPIDDAMTEGSGGINNGLIKIQQSGPARIGYFKFDVAGLTSSEIQGAKLRLTVNQDPGSGTLNLYQGSTNAWTEETLNSANAPSTGVLVDCVGGTHANGQVVEFDVSSAITDSGTYTFVLQHGGGNDVWFSSKEGSSAPQLVIDLHAGTTVPGDYNGDNTVDGADYSVWRQQEGAIVTPLTYADGNGNGVIDEADFRIWRSNYGAVGSVASTSQAIEVSPAAPVTTPVSPFLQNSLLPSNGLQADRSQSFLAAKITEELFSNRAAERLQRGSKSPALPSSLTTGQVENGIHAGRFDMLSESESQEPESNEADALDAFFAAFDPGIDSVPGRRA